MSVGAKLRFLRPHRTLIPSNYMSKFVWLGGERSSAPPNPTLTLITDVILGQTIPGDAGRGARAKPDRANEIILYLHNIVSSIQWFNLTDASWSGAKAHPDQASVRLNYWYSDRMCVKKVHGLETCSRAPKQTTKN